MAEVFAENGLRDEPRPADGENRRRRCGEKNQPSADQCPWNCEKTATDCAGSHTADDESIEAHWESSDGANETGDCIQSGDSKTLHSKVGVSVDSELYP